MERHYPRIRDRDANCFSATTPSVPDHRPDLLSCRGFPARPPALVHNMQGIELVISVLIDYMDK